LSADRLLLIKRSASVIIVLLFCGLLAFAAVACSCSPAVKRPQVSAPATLDETNTLFLYGIDPLTLDPSVSHELLSQDYIVQIFSGLVRLDEDLNMQPDLAESWDIENGTVYTFLLREDARFHDGRAVTAEDVKYSWERSCNPATASPTASTYLGDIVGVQEVLEGNSEEISGLSIIDDRTIRVTIEAPIPYFLSKLTYTASFIVDRNNVASGKDWWHNPNGTGPFKLLEWDQKNLLVLLRNADYYGKKAGVEAVIFQMYSGRPMNLYEQQQLDVTSVSLSYIDKVLDETGPYYEELAIFPEMSLSYIGFNCTKPPFDDVNIRKAFSMAVDKDRIVSLVFRNMASKADGILPPGLPGYKEDLAGLEYDVDRARELIKESKYGDVSNLPPITLTTSGRGGFIFSYLESIIYQWRENLGVDVKVRQLEPERYFYNLREEKDELYDIGWMADYPHPQNFLEILFATDSDNNYGGYSNPQVDVLLQKAGVEQDPEESIKLYRQAEQLMVDDAACIPLYTGESYYLIRPYVKGFSVNAVGLSMLNNVTIEPH
jgi:oligopeptide transport system substrate-binding protein